MASALAQLILSLRETGFPLILLWLLSLAITYGILSHVKIPESISARGVISIVVSFLILFAVVASQVVNFVTNLIVASVMIAFGLLIVVMFLEIAGAKKEGKHIFALHPKFFGGAIVVLMILIFIGAGGLGILNIPEIKITTPILAIIFFLIIMVVAIWIMFKEGGDSGGKGE